MRMKDLAYTHINQLSLLELKIVPCTKPANHQYIMKPAAVERFVYIVKGKGCFTLQDQVLCAGERDMIYLPGETAYRSHWPVDSEFMVVDLLLHNAEGNPIRFGEEPGILFCDTHGAYRGLLEELAAKADANGPFDWLERLSLSFKLLCEMARETNRSELDAKNRKIKEGLAYLQNNVAEDFPISRLAEMCCLSSGRFRQIFTECLGMTPVEYRNKLRIQKAQTMLKTGNFTVGEVAEAVGIPDIKYFSKLFKRHIGIAPSAMKKYG
jgi:AraC-like DNA-binding protein